LCRDPHSRHADVDALAPGLKAPIAGFYTDIADVIRQLSSKPVNDLHELWRRIVFTILVSNRDDHLKNHGFTYAGGDRWRLSPAFDINPSTSRHRVLETGIIQGGSFEASLEIALEASEFFDIKQEDARRKPTRLRTQLKGIGSKRFVTKAVRLKISVRTRTRLSIRKWKRL